jgi:hypothetical protein
MAVKLAALLLVAVLLTGGALLVRGGGAEREAAGAVARTVVWAAGDGADGSPAARQLARYVKRQRPGRFLYLGDVYDSGTATEFAQHYDPVYGPLAQRTDPVVGNHEYGLRASGYFPYWRRQRGWSPDRALHRSYVDASGWQVIAYSSESDPAQEAAWVRRQVVRRGGTCRIAAAHRGRYVLADTAHDDNVDQGPIWHELAGRTAINLIGHNHIYARLTPIDGVTVLLSGAGGHDLRGLGQRRHPVAAVKIGVPTATRLVLRRGAADFRQVDAKGRVYDSGTVRCTPAR